MVNKTRHARRELNLRLLLITAAAGALIAAAGHLWHGYQLRRNAGALLARVDEALGASELPKATTVLRQYLRFRPYDAEQQIRLAQLVDRLAQSRREKEEALRLHTVAVGLTTECDDLLRRRAELSFELAYFSDAIRQADDLLRIHADDAGAQRVKALSLAAQARLAGQTPSESVAQVFEQAIKHLPADVDLATELATIYRSQMPSAREGDPSGRIEKASLADRVMDRLIEASPRSSDAFLARYQYRQAHGLADADDDLRQALALDSAGTSFLVRVAAGLKQLAAGASEQAAALFDQAIATNPRDERGYLGLGRARDAAGDLLAARETWQQGLKSAEPASPALNFELARSAIVADELDEARIFLERLERELRRRGGQMPPRQRAQWLDQVTALRADWHFARGDFARAVELFEDLAAQPNDAGQPQLIHKERGSRLHARLGAARGRLGQWDRAVTELEKSIALMPESHEQRLSLAEAYQRAGRLDDAIDQYTLLLNRDEPPPTVWLQAARALLERQLAAPSDRRQWDEFDTVFLQAQRAAAEDSEVLLLAAERAFAGENGDAASLQLLHVVEASRDYNFCERACAVFQRWRRLDEADRCLRQARQAGLPEQRRALAAAALAVARRNLADAEQLLHSALDAAGAPQRTEIGLRLALVLLSGGQTQRAKDQLESLHADDAQNQHVVQMLAELAWEEADLDSLEINERRLHVLEGPEGTLWRFFRGLRLSADSPHADETQLAAAGQLQSEIERARPNWPAAFLLKGRLAEQQKHADDAIAAYFTALRLGERRPEVYAYLATRLYQLGRYADAHSVLEELKSRQPLSISLTGLELALDVRAGDLASAIELARRQLASRPHDPASQVWLGQILDVGGRHNEAEAALKRGVELSPADARAWIALLQHDLAAGNPRRARQTFEEMQRRVVVSDKQRPFLFAQCHELLGDREAAAAAYRQAIEAAPDVAAVWQRAARFYYAFDRGQAEACLRRVIELSPDDATLARRMVAALLVGADGERALAAASQLLETRGFTHSERITNQRLHARLALRHGAPQQRREAQRLLEELVGQDQAPPARDRLLLAQEYEREGRLRSAKDQLLALVLVDRPAPDDLARLTEFLLRHERADEAHDWLDRLAQAEPEAESFRTLSLRVAWLKQRGELPGIEAAIGAFLERRPVSQHSPAEQAATWARIAGLYDEAGLHEQAEASYRRAAAEHVSGRCACARWLAANHRVADAVSMCLAHRGEDRTPQTAITLATVLSHCPRQANRVPAAEQFLEQSAQQYPTSAILLASLATLRMMQGDTEQARRGFEQVLAIDPDHLIALNNLAMLLADDPSQRPAALAYVDRALVHAGRHPELLDSKGWVLLQSDDAAGAEALFREAADLAPNDPRPSFHLALSCWAQGKSLEARQALQRAEQRKLSVDQLHAPEQRRLAELQHEFDG